MNASEILRRDTQFKCRCPSATFVVLIYLDASWVLHTATSRNCILTTFGHARIHGERSDEAGLETAYSKALGMATSKSTCGFLSHGSPDVVKGKLWT